MFLENENITLRALEPEDLDSLYEWENSRDLWIHGNTLTPYSRNTLRQYIVHTQQSDIYESKQLRLIVVLKQGNISIGTIDLYDLDVRYKRAGIGIFIEEQQRGKGYGFQSLKLMKQYAFDLLQLHQLYAYIPTYNKPSHSLFRKSGYEFSALLKDWVVIKGKYTDLNVLQLINKEE